MEQQNFSIILGSVSLTEDFINTFGQKGTERAGIERLLDMLDRGDFDLGTGLIANPDWPKRICDGRPVSAFDPKARATLDQRSRD